MKHCIKLLFIVLAFQSCKGSESEENTRAEDNTPEQENIQTGTAIGERAPDIVLQNPEGKEMSLSGLRGSVVLLDFWASWCAPCRRENPNLVRQYEKYKEKGFTIYSVSLDLKKEDWVKAIQKDNLSWPFHVSDLKFWYSEPAERYKIEAIPANFILDENGIILAKDLYGKELDTFLNKLFSN